MKKVTNVGPGEYAYMAKIDLNKCYARLLRARNKELAELEAYLREHGYQYYMRALHGGEQIIVSDPKTGTWDAICHRFSYGHEQGRLEVMGDITGGDVEGWLTAKDIIERIEAKQREARET